MYPIYLIYLIDLIYLICPSIHLSINCIYASIHVCISIYLAIIIYPSIRSIRFYFICPVLSYPIYPCAMSNYIMARVRPREYPRFITRWKCCWSGHMDLEALDEMAWKKPCHIGGWPMRHSTTKSMWAGLGSSGKNICKSNPRAFWMLETVATPIMPTPAYPS